MRQRLMLMLQSSFVDVVVAVAVVVARAV